MASDGLWMAMNRTIPGGKFHYVTVQSATDAIEDYDHPVAICRAELDETRQWDRKEHGTSRLCKICLRMLDPNSEEDLMDPKDGTNNGYGSYSDPIAAQEGSLSYGREPVLAINSKRSKVEAQLERHRKQTEYYEAKLARLEALPGEPEVEDGEPNVVWFTKVFQNGSVEYTYAATKASNGLWYTTGPSSPKGYTWEALVEWIADGKEYNLWHAAAYSQL